MSSTSAFDEAVIRLQSVHGRLVAGEYRAVFEPGPVASQAVYDFYQPVFSTQHLNSLSAAEFLQFLNFRSNKHWSGLHRQGPKIVADMEGLRKGLALLLDESLPIDARYDQALARIHHMGRAIATAILHVAYPAKYGVWNRKSEHGLKVVELWPRFDFGDSEGSRYSKINRILIDLAEALDTDLWTLDALWHYLLMDVGETTSIGPEGDREPDEDQGAAVEDATEVAAGDSAPVSPAVQRFGLESHLHEFLFDNWNNTELGKDWALYSETGNVNAGYKYTVGVGEIDLLARHRREAKWLVVELKRGNSDDQTVGQILRYMGWVKHKMAQPQDQVLGLIVVHQPSKKLVYAASAVPNLDLRTYQVHFELLNEPPPADVE